MTQGLTACCLAAKICSIVASVLHVLQETHQLAVYVWHALTKGRWCSVCIANSPNVHG